MQFYIVVRSSGVILGLYDGETADDAIEAMSRDAGYASFRDQCAISDPDDLDSEVARQRFDLIVLPK